MAADTYSFRAHQRMTGREEPDPDSPELTWGNGQPRAIEAGDCAYTRLDELPGPDEWVLLFQIPDGHGQHMLGYFQAGRFTIEGPFDSDEGTPACGGDD